MKKDITKKPIDIVEIDKMVKPEEIIRYQEQLNSIIIKL